MQGTKQGQEETENTQDMIVLVQLWRVLRVLPTSMNNSGKQPIPGEYPNYQTDNKSYNRCLLVDCLGKPPCNCRRNVRNIVEQTDHEARNNTVRNEHKAIQ